MNENGILSEREILSPPSNSSIRAEAHKWQDRFSESGHYVVKSYVRPDRAHLVEYDLPSDKVGPVIVGVVRYDKEHDLVYSNANSRMPTNPDVYLGILPSKVMLIDLND